MVRFVINYLFTRYHFTWDFYKKNYECIIPSALMVADLIWVATATYHGFKNYDIMITNSARDRHEEYDQFLKFHSHQWWLGPGLREDLAKPRRDLFDLYTEMEKRWKALETKEEACVPSET